VGSARRATTPVLLLAALCGAAGASAQLRAPEPAVVFELATLTGGLQTQGVLHRDSFAPERAGEPGELRARWWWRAGGVELGTGSDWATDRTLQPHSGARPVLGLRTELSSRTRFVYEFRPPEHAHPTGTAPGLDPAGRMRWALEFKPSNPGRTYARGLLRVELSSASTLSFRPRGGGLAMTWNSRW
jgi:hypothetical protein